MNCDIIMKDEKINILIVDDSKLARLTIKYQLKKNNRINIAGEASNGGEAIDMYKKLKPDIVTMDLDMPIMGGVEAIEQILLLDKEAKIVVISAMEQKYMVDEAKEKGAQFFISKPFNDENFKEFKKCLQLK